jgi:uncharacterized protein DUF6551
MTRTIPAPINLEPEFRYVPLESIMVDPRVQRPLNNLRARKMADEFDPRSLGTITLNDRGEILYSNIDGRHRCEAARLAGYVSPLAARVYRGLTLRQEAEMFLALNETRVPTPVSKFLVGIQAEDSAIATVNKIIANYGWEVGHSAGRGKITAAAALLAIYNGAKVGSRQGSRSDLVHATIASITEAWGHESDAVKASMMLGVASVYARYGSRIDRDRLVSKMSSVTPRAALAQGAQARAFIGSTEYAGISRWLVSEYNKGLRKNPLPDWQWLK